MPHVDGRRPESRDGNVHITRGIDTRAIATPPERDQLEDIVITNRIHAWIISCW
jgi:hypothetical protein